MPHPPKPKPRPDDPEQSARFIEAARELGADVSEEEAERAFGRIVPPRRAGDPPPRKPEPSPAASGRGRPKKRG